MNLSRGPLRLKIVMLSTSKIQGVSTGDRLDCVRADCIGRCSTWMAERHGG